VLAVLGLENDLAELASTDTLGRQIQYLALEPARKTPP